MKRICFICHGNICRSPMAEILFRDMAQRAGKEVIVASAATSTEELGNPVYPPARAELARHGFSCAGKYAVQVQAADYEKYDLFPCMDDANVRNLQRIFRGDPAGKIRKLMDYTPRGGSVADPWYTGEFRTAYQDIEEGCRGLLAALD